MVLSHAALEGTADGSQGWGGGSLQPLASTPLATFFSPVLPFSTIWASTAPRLRPLLEPPFHLLPLQHLRRGQLLSVASTPGPGPDPRADALRRPLTGTTPAPCYPRPLSLAMETLGVSEGAEVCSRLSRSRGRHSMTRAPKHLWRQPRRPIRIQQRFYSDPDKSAGCRERDLSPRPGLGKSRLSWPISSCRR